jgi:hypothetical protein
VKVRRGRVQEVSGFHGGVRAVRRMKRREKVVTETKAVSWLGFLGTSICSCFNGLLQLGVALRKIAADSLVKRI